MKPVNGVKAMLNPIDNATRSSDSSLSSLGYSASINVYPGRYNEVVNPNAIRM